ncbi:GAF and ANTAR domain-containing protein [Streptomyces sp. NPDC001691]|uniref:GAF and ANTAR domain-containing protein n=1 Tax=Streptomyces sp. NPDC001691 TaxID=3364600 RepID=UPI0036C05F19
MAVDDCDDGRARQEELVRRITAALSTVGDDGVPEQLPAQLCRACVDVLPVTGGSVSIASPDRVVRATWYASDAIAAQLAEAQYTLGDGPCHSALAQAVPVLAPDLSSASDARRWPFFALQAVELGVHAVFSLPLGGLRPAGTLDLYRDAPGPLSGFDLEAALLARDALGYALFALASARNWEPQGRAASWMDAAEADHDEVHQAIGMVMVQLGLDPRQALDRLRARAFTQGRAVTEVARDVVRRVVRLSDTDDEDAPEQGDGGKRDGLDEER